MNKFNYDYSKTMWMKIYLADADYEHNCSKVLISFEQTLDIVKKVDAITQGITKILYLVGWQALGHDCGFPEMEVVNDYLKRDCDKDGRESLLWLVEEAKKYHTVISYHGNISDEYAENASHQEFVDANAICNGIDGKPAVIEVYNTRNAYKISYKQYWESGLFRKYFDRFCETVPVREAGTVHLDNLCIAESLNPRTTMTEQDEARNKILDYIASLGIDVTTEYTYRELDLRADQQYHPIRELYKQLGEELPVGDWRDAPIRCLGRIAASWWTNGMTVDDMLNIKPSLYTGHPNDGALASVFYGTMHGEDVWMEHGTDSRDWAPEFIRQFCTYQLPFLYLNRYDRLKVDEDSEMPGQEGRYTATLSDGVISRGCDLSISKNGVVMKQGGDVILPLTEDNRLYIAYSEKGRSGSWNMPDAAFGEADLYEITPEGNVPAGRAAIADGKIELDLKPGQAFAIYAV